MAGPQHLGRAVGSSRVTRVMPHSAWIPGSASCLIKGPNPTAAAQCCQGRRRGLSEFALLSRDTLIIHYYVIGL